MLAVERVDDDRRQVQVPVVHVVRQDLVRPLHLAGLGVQLDHGVGVGVGAGPRAAPRLRRRAGERRRVGDVDVHRALVVEGGRVPQAATGVDGLVAPQGRRHGVERPARLAGAGVEGVEHALAVALVEALGVAGDRGDVDQAVVDRPAPCRCPRRRCARASATARAPCPSTRRARRRSDSVAPKTLPPSTATPFGPTEISLKSCVHSTLPVCLVERRDVRVQVLRVDDAVEDDRRRGVRAERPVPLIGEVQAIPSWSTLLESISLLVATRRFFRSPFGVGHSSAKSCRLSGAPSGTSGPSPPPQAPSKAAASRSAQRGRGVPNRDSSASVLPRRRPGETFGGWPRRRSSGSAADCTNRIATPTEPGRCTRRRGPRHEACVVAFPDDTVASVPQPEQMELSRLDVGHGPRAASTSCSVIVGQAACRRRRRWGRSAAGAFGSGHRSRRGTREAVRERVRRGGGPSARRHASVLPGPAVGESMRRWVFESPVHRSQGASRHGPSRPTAAGECRCGWRAGHTVPACSHTAPGKAAAAVATRSG